MLTLAHQSDRKKQPTLEEYRPITLEEAKQVKFGDTFYCLSNHGKAINVRVASAVKRWKRDPDRIEITFKYGLYESERMDTEAILRRILVKV